MKHLLIAGAGIIAVAYFALYLRGQIEHTLDNTKASRYAPQIPFGTLPGPNTQPKGGVFI
jgi:hypothetical protein